MLSPYRVLDVTDERGHFAGLLLAGLGAEVIKIEPPRGVRARRLPPFAPDGTSLTHAAYDRGKRSVALDLETHADRERFLGLVDGADVVLDSLGAGSLENLGLGFDTLLARNPSLVVGTVTAFGHDGPKANWPATDLTVMASGCTMAFTGDADRAPLRVGVPQAFHLGAAVMAGGVVAALIERARSGEGQIVDVAAQQVVPIATQAGVLSEAANFSTPIRSGGGASVGPIDLRFVYPAKDGFVSITHVFGDAIGPVTARLMEWVAEEGYVDPAIAGLDWVNFAPLLEAGEVSVETWETAKAGIASLTGSLTKAELLEQAMARRLLIAPIADTAEVIASEQLAARDYLVDVAVGRHRAQAPGDFTKASATPLTRLDAVPSIGQDDELLGRVRSPAIGGPEGTTEPRPPLDGVHVLDFTWSLAGPFLGRLLADLGATIIKVESVHKPDPARGFLPIWDNVPGLEQSALFDTANAGKRSLALDLRDERAREVVRDLVGWADVVAESFSPRAMRGWGLGYEDLREINPDIVMLSTCLTGQDGPLSGFAGYGNLGAALSGFYGLAGWPDRPPSGPFGAYTDYTSTHVMAVAVLAAIDHRRRTGQGQHLDLAQAEAAMHYIAPALIAASIDGTVTERDGNRDPGMAPHGVFRCRGEDEWVAVAVESDEMWARLCELMDRRDLRAVAELGDVAGRLAAVDRVEEAVASWTADLDPAVAERRLIDAGIAAHRVQSSSGCLADPQLRHRGHFVEQEYPGRGCIVEACRVQLSRSPVGPFERAPQLGEHTFEILSEVLGYDADAIAELAAAEILE